MSLPRAALVFGVLTVAQLFALPARECGPAEAATTIVQDWRSVLANRSFLLFAAAMTGSYVLSFQVYLALPLQAGQIVPQPASILVAAVFVAPGRWRCSANCGSPAGVRFGGARPDHSRWACS